MLSIVSNESTHFKSGHLSNESLDDDLHATMKMEDEVGGGFFLDVIVRECAIIPVTIEDSMITLPIKALTKICMPPHRYKMRLTL